MATLYATVVVALGQQVRDLVDAKTLKTSEAKAKSETLATEQVGGATDDEVLVILRQASHRPLTRRLPATISTAQPLGAVLRAVAAVDLGADVYEWWRDNR